MVRTLGASTQRTQSGKPFPAFAARPTDQAVVLVPGNSGWTKTVRLFCSQATADYFKLFEVPDPPGSDPVYGNGSQFRDPGRTRTKATGWYRIAYDENPGSSKPHTTRFRLSSGHTLQTLAWLTDYLNSTGVDWLWLCNAHGNPLSRSAFRSVPQ